MHSIVCVQAHEISFCLIYIQARPFSCFYKKMQPMSVPIILINLTRRIFLLGLINLKSKISVESVMPFKFTKAIYSSERNSFSYYIQPATDDSRIAIHRFVYQKINMKRMYWFIFGSVLDSRERFLASEVQTHLA